MCNIPECNACHAPKDLRQSDWKFNICGQIVQMHELSRYSDKCRWSGRYRWGERYLFRVGDGEGVYIEVCADINADVLQILRDTITAPDWQAPKRRL